MTLRTAALAAIIMAIIVAACGGGDDNRIEDLEATAAVLSLEATVTTLTFEATVTAITGDALHEYFSELEPLSQAFDADLDLLDEGETLDEFVSFVEDGKSLVEDFVGDLDALDGPAEVEDAHRFAVSAGRELVDMFGHALIVLDLSETFEDATLVLEGPGFVDSQDRFAASCVALQGIAESNALDVDLSCPR